MFAKPCLALKPRRARARYLPRITSGPRAVRRQRKTARSFVFRSASAIKSNCAEKIGDVVRRSSETSMRHRKMPIPSEGLDAHFLPSAGRKRETSNSIFCESAGRGVQKLRFARSLFLSRRSLSSRLSRSYAYRVGKRSPPVLLYPLCSKHGSF